jgi:hypothetical protein
MSVSKLQRSVSCALISHKNGIKTILPQTPFVLELFHTALRLYRLDESTPILEIIFPNIGLVANWTAFFDYSHQQVVVEGFSSEGFFRYVVSIKSDGIYLTARKKPLMMRLSLEEQTLTLDKPFLLAKHRVSFSEQSRPCLLLGCNKAPLIDAMREHPIMEQILPVIYHQAMPAKISLTTESLLGKIVDAVENGRRADVLGLVRLFWTIALVGNCVPKRFDDLFFGYEAPLIPASVPLDQALHILSHAIRCLFIQEDKQQIYLLPCLPKEFLSGRLLDEVLQSGHRISFEWRRGAVRRILLHAVSDDEIVFHTGAASCSIRCLTLKNRKTDQNLSDSIAIKSGYRYLLDNFV